MKKEITTLIKEIVKTQTGINDLDSKTRKRPFVIARQIYLYLCKKYTRYSLSDLGALLNKDHATVIHSVKKVNQIIETNDSYLDWVLSCESSLIEALKTTETIGVSKEKEKTMPYDKVLLKSKVSSLEKEIERLRLELFVEKQKSKFKNEKYKEFEKYLNQIPTQYLNEFYETRIIPYAKMCESKVIN